MVYLINTYTIALIPRSSHPPTSISWHDTQTEPSPCLSWKEEVRGEGYPLLVITQKWRNLAVTWTRVEGLYCKRTIQCLASSELLTLPPPHPLTARRVCTTPPLVRGKDTLARGRGGGGSIVRKTPDTALYSYVLCAWRAWANPHTVQIHFIPHKISSSKLTKQLFDDKNSFLQILYFLQMKRNTTKWNQITKICGINHRLFMLNNQRFNQI